MLLLWLLRLPLGQSRRLSTRFLSGRSAGFGTISVCVGEMLFACRHLVSQLSSAGPNSHLSGALVPIPAPTATPSRPLTR